MKTVPQELSAQVARRQLRQLVSSSLSIATAYITLGSGLCFLSLVSFSYFLGLLSLIYFLSYTSFFPAWGWGGWVSDSCEELTSNSGCYFHCVVVLQVAWIKQNKRKTTLF